MKFVQEIDDPANLRALVVQDLKEFGIKVPKSKKNKLKDEGCVDSGSKLDVFGTSLANVPSIILEEYGAVPKFLVEATQVIERHVGTEGLFRKSGSLARQKELRQCIEDGGDLVPTAHPFDVTSLVKQFFRELPDPLLTFRLHDTFLRCFALESEQVRHMTILLTCHLLPAAHMSTLRFTMHFLQCVAAHCGTNKMDLQNLAVCMAPNLLYAPGKCDRAMAAESRLLQQETGVIQLLMERADAVGMVSDSLWQRTSLMASCCFPSDEELERSEVEDVRTGKKKKRSGSFQGLVSNLSSSFSRWRRDCKGGHNSSNMSDKSSMSYMMTERSSFVTTGDVSPVTVSSAAMLSYDGYDSLCTDTLPKVVRKRKAEEDTVPFSASKKKAILQNMPHMSTLGNTPFTPAVRKARPEEFQDTPQISFADDSHAIFSATPRMKMEPLLLSPTSSSKCKRSNSSRYNNQAKSCCFSPKTPKSGVKRTVKGFLRRLSGSKDTQSSHNTSDLSQLSDDAGGFRPAGAVRRGGEGGIVIIDPSDSRKKGLFRRHAKTPSSPGRLVTSVTSDQGDWTMNDVTSMDRAEESVSDSQLDTTGTRGHHQRGYSGDTSLRRGRPNTLKSGLPSPRHKRLSVEQDASSKRGATFVSPVKCEMLDCGPGAFDTSPIASIAPDVTGDDCMPPSTVMSQVDTEQRDDNVTMEIDESSSNVDHLPLDHDNAFIHESILCTETAPAIGLEMTCLETDMGDDEDEMAPVEVYNETVPVTNAAAEQVIVPTTGSIERSPGRDVPFCCPEERSLNIEASNGCNDAGDSRLTSEMNGETSPTRDSSPATDNGSDTASMLRPQLSDASLDSAVCLSSDTASVGSATGLSSNDTSVDIALCAPSGNTSADSSLTDTRLNAPLAGDSRDKSQSTASVASSDSGIGLGAIQTGHSKPCSPQLADYVHSAVLAQRGDQDMLCVKDNQLSQDERSANDIVTKPASPGRHLTESGERYWSPLRFPSSPLRRPRRGNSPVRIPTIFAKADLEASKFRDLAKSALRAGASPKHRRQPSLPISTALLRTHAVESARYRLSVADNNNGVKLASSRADTQAGHTPLRVSRSATDHASDDHSLRVPLRMNNSMNMDECMSVASKLLTADELASATPQIKPPLLAGNQRLLTSALVTPRRCRSPAKPVKRLQGSCSPASPRRYGRSPRRYKKSPVKPTQAYSPGATPSHLPAHVIDWNV